MAQDATWYGGRPRPRRHCVTHYVTFDGQLLFERVVGGGARNFYPGKSKNSGGLVWVAAGPCTTLRKSPDLHDYRKCHRSTLEVQIPGHPAARRLTAERRMNAGGRLLTSAVHDEDPLANVARHGSLGVLKQVRHVNNGVVDHRVGAGCLSEARVDDRATLFVETDLSLNKPTDLSCPHCRGDYHPRTDAHITRLALWEDAEADPEGLVGARSGVHRGGDNLH